MSISRKKAACVFILIPLLAAYVLAGAKDTLKKGSMVVSTKTGTFMLSDFTLWRESDECFMTGSVTNNTDRAWRYAAFDVSLFDKDGKAVHLGMPVGTQIAVHPVAKGATNKVTDSLDRSPARLGECDRKIGDFKISFNESVSYFDSSYVFSLVKPIESTDLTFEDDVLGMSFSITRERLAFALRNKVADPITVRWDEVSYIDLSGKSHRVIHEGIKLADTDKPQAPTVIPPTARIEDFVFPADHVSWNSYLTMWSQLPMLPPTQEAPQFKGGTFSIFLPVDVNGQKKNYLFTFKISDVQI